MARSKGCKYFRAGKCDHKDAPNPEHSECIGKDECGSYEREKVTLEMLDASVMQLMDKAQELRRQWREFRK